MTQKITQPKAKTSEKSELTNRELAIIRNNPPRRSLALEDWGELSVTPAEFDRLRAEAIELPFPDKFKTPLDELITRACYLLFALIESGGLCVSNPNRKFEHLTIDSEAVIARYLNVPVSDRGRKKADFPVPVAHDKSEKREVITGTDLFQEDTKEINGNFLKDDQEEDIAVRQPLHLLGANHLLAFVYYRYKTNKKLQVQLEGTKLLPELPADLKSFRQQTTLSWLADYRQQKPRWSSIFTFWLKKKIAEYRSSETPIADVSWNDIKEIAVWHLLDKERFPLISAYRQRKVTTTNLPGAKMRRILAGESYEFGGKQRPAKKSVSGTDEIADDGNLPDDFKKVRDFLDSVVRDVFDVKQARAQYLKRCRELQTANFKTGDLKDFLAWCESMLDRRLKMQTIYSYGQLVIRFLEETYPVGFSDVTTSDVASYLDNTCGSPNTVRNVRGALRNFAKFLSRNSLSSPQVFWHSNALKAFEQGRERDILTEAEYRQIRDKLKEKSGGSDYLENLVLMTLLRRCGLRIGEVSWLTVSDFIGMDQLLLKVPRSKTRSGLNRLLPVYLLLDDEELGELKEFLLEIRTRIADKSVQYLFIKKVDSPSASSQNEKVLENKEIDDLGLISNHMEIIGGADPQTFWRRTGSSSLGMRAEKIINQCGFPGETAHGLRHSLASDLFAAYFLSLIDLPDRSNKFFEVLGKFTRFSPDEKMFIQHLYHIQLIMGHSDMFVTFDRYIHLVEIALWYLVKDYENHGPADLISANSLSRLAGKDFQDLKSILVKNYDVSYRADFSELGIENKIVNDYLKERLIRIIRRK